MTRLLLSVKWLSLAAWFVALVVHVWVLLHWPVPSAVVQHLHRVQVVMTVGIFVVWWPTAWVAQRMTERHGGSGGQGVVRFSWADALQGCPPWMRNTAYGLFIYTFINFFVSFGMGLTGAGAADALGRMRMFSGLWLLFYGLAFAMMYSTLRTPSLVGQRSCSAGHAVRRGDSFCGQCGQPMPPQ
nr:hypothetical protein [uncultured Comamonas sp.]